MQAFICLYACIYEEKFVSLQCNKEIDSKTIKNIRL